MFRNQWLWFRQLLINIFLFLQKITNISSIHGFVYVMNYSLHFLERWLWYVCIISALVACSSLARSTWTRFQTSPTVITMDRNKFFWNTSFPTLTICPHKRIDELKVGNYYRTVLAKEPTNMTLEANFINFIVKLSNVSFASIGEMPLDETYGLPSVDYLELIHNFTWPFQPEVTSGIGVKMHLNAVVTELGICYTFNSMVSVYNSFAYWKRNRWNRLAKHEQNVTLTAHPLDGEIYAQILNMSCSYDVYFHGPSEAMEMSQQVYSFGATNYATVNLLALEIRTSADAKKFDSDTQRIHFVLIYIFLHMSSRLTTSQRQCRFANEAETLASSPVYSYNLCQMECRKHMIEFLCGCVPHFYRPTGKHKRVYKVCDLDGFRCVLHIKGMTDG